MFFPCDFIQLTLLVIELAVTSDFTNMKWVFHSTCVGVGVDDFNLRLS